MPSLNFAHEVKHDGITSYFSVFEPYLTSLHTTPKIGDVFYLCSANPILYVRMPRRWDKRVWQAGESSESKVVHPVHQHLTLVARTGGALPRWTRGYTGAAQTHAIVVPGLAEILRELADHGVQPPEPVGGATSGGPQKTRAPSRSERTMRINAAQERGELLELRELQTLQRS
ncbi:hypothetical protein BV25DRAFT_1297144 [Artomyces pyxidatus]|uniref:Uncharacterized protein n=1 Tax=Artomyces pyxidatus TaxID=48021 RepID=A0ACB8SP02_9AGAM|nr:hypothetical protein BV25DRAFT_1297144 [Artomyces pyxidatus]